MEISVIMAATLKDYEGAAKNRNFKLIRAIKSFCKARIKLTSTEVPHDAELIVVSDNCPHVIAFVNHFFPETDYPYIKRVLLKNNREVFSGDVRQKGLELSKFPWICYLDSDDMFDVNHLSFFTKLEQEKTIDFYYYNEAVLVSSKKVKDSISSKKKIVYEYGRKEVKLEHGSIGTSSILHRRNFKNGFVPSWTGKNGYGHDWLFIEEMMKKGDSKRFTVPFCTYIICHIPSLNIDN